MSYFFAWQVKYPQMNRKASQTEFQKPQARIIAVADVFETIASHRPYRPSLGLPRAVEEIRENSGVLYDEQVVAVFLRLVEEKRFPAFN